MWSSPSVVGGLHSDIEGICARVAEGHPHTLANRNNVAAVLNTQGKLDEAEHEHRAVLDARTRLLGAEHPDTLVL